MGTLRAIAHSVFRRTPSGRLTDRGLTTSLATLNKNSSISLQDELRKMANRTPYDDRDEKSNKIYEFSYSFRYFSRKLALK